MSFLGYFNFKNISFKFLHSCERKSCVDNKRFARSNIRDLKHRQRNGTRTTGGSKIFPLELSAHVRYCQNVVKPSLTTESEKVFRSGEKVRKQLKFCKVIIFYFHLLM